MSQITSKPTYRRAMFHQSATPWHLGARAGKLQAQLICKLDTMNTPSQSDRRKRSVLIHLAMIGSKELIPFNILRPREATGRLAASRVYLGDLEILSDDSLIEVYRALDSDIPAYLDTPLWIKLPADGPIPYKASRETVICWAIAEVPDFPVLFHDMLQRICEMPIHPDPEHSCPTGEIMTCFMSTFWRWANHLGHTTHPCFPDARDARDLGYLMLDTAK